MTPTQQLQSGIQALGLDLSAEQQTLLLAYTDLLKKWNKTYNLTALRDEAQMVSHHLLDSLTRTKELMLPLWRSRDQYPMKLQYLLRCNRPQ